MKDKKDYSRFYISMVLILAFLLGFITVSNAIGDIKHAEKDLAFVNEMTEFVIFEAEIIGYCANMSNLSNEDLLTKFMEHKAEEIIKGTFNEGKGMEWAIWEENSVVEVDNE